MYSTPATVPVKRHNLTFSRSAESEMNNGYRNAAGVNKV